MVWARLDDAILDNPKISRAGIFGFALHVAAITWCNRNLTDGFVPYSRAASLLDLSAVNFDTANPCAVAGGPASMSGDTGLDPHVVADHLVAVGLWTFDDDAHGYWLHDFLTYNPSRESVLGKRQKESARAQSSRTVGPRPPRMSSIRKPKAPAGSLPATTEQAAANNPPTIRHPDPDPDPVPERDPRRISIGTESAAPTPPPEPVTAVRLSRRKPETPCPASDATPEVITAWAAGWKVPADHPEFTGWLDHHRKSDARWRDWAAAWRTWLKNASRFGQRSFARDVQQSAEGRCWKLPEGF